MTRFRPARIVGGAVVAEAEPFERGVAILSRGVDLGYGWPERVIVREPNPDLDEEEAFEDLFLASLRGRQALRGSPAPRLLSVFGRPGRPMVAVEEDVSGVRFDELLGCCDRLGARLSAQVALALAHDLLALWEAAERASPPVALNVDLSRLLVDPSGRARALPELSCEHISHTVGAAAIVIEAPIAYSSPEQLRGWPHDPRSGMFTFGLVLHYLLTGDHPAGEAGIPFRVLSRLANTQLPSITSVRPDLEPPIAELVDRCLAHDPSGRFTGWEELRYALSAARALLPCAGAEDVLALADAVLPASRRLAPSEPVDPRDLLGWESLPRSGYLQVEIPEAPQALSRAVRQAHPEETPQISAEVVYVGRDLRPMYRLPDGLLADASPVTSAEYERFLLASGYPRPPYHPPPDPLDGERPATMLSYEDCVAYAAWAGKRLPTEAQWRSAADTIGAERLDMGLVWEWTSDPHARGHVVCGGRWRNAWERPADPSNRSYETGPAPDLGFRCFAGP